jgi:hypothetical protein
MASTTTQPNSRHSQRSQHSCPAGPARVTLGRNACGVLLKLEERQPNGSRVMVVTAFTQASCLEEWCMDDPLRFEAPIVHQHVRRDADALWRNDS